MKDHAWLFVLTFVVFLILSAVLSVVLSLALSSWTYGILIGVVAFIAATVYTLVKAWFIVPEKHEVVIELLGEYYDTWTAGVYFFYPFFGIMVVKNETLYFMGEDEMNLFTSKELVDFTDDSAVIFGKLFFKIVDSYKAAYGIANLDSSLEDKSNSAVRHYFSPMTYDAANRSKGAINVPGVMNGEEVIILRNWGVELIDIAVEDIKLSEESIAIRRRLLDAETENSIAAKKAAAGIKMLAVKEKELKIVGEGLSDQVKLLAGTGLGVNRAAEYLVNQAKWKAVESGGNSLIIEGNGQSSQGAKFGAGFSKGSSVTTKPGTTAAPTTTPASTGSKTAPSPAPKKTP